MASLTFGPEHTCLPTQYTGPDNPLPPLPFSEKILQGQFALDNCPRTVSTNDKHPSGDFPHFVVLGGNCPGWELSGVGIVQITLYEVNFPWNIVQVGITLASVCSGP